MEDPELLKIIRDNPVGKGLDGCRALFYTLCEDENVTPTPDAPKNLGDDALSDIALSLVAALRLLPASRLLCSRFRNKPICLELSNLSSAIRSGKFGRSRIIPLLNVVLDDASEDTQIWDQVYKALIESITPPTTLASDSQQTPYSRNTSSFVNSSEQRSHMDKILEMELRPLYVGLPDFYKAFFGRVEGLAEASRAVFLKCKEGSSPLFDQGWRDWPINANEKDVLRWFKDLSEKLEAFAQDINPNRTYQRSIYTEPNLFIEGSTARRKLDLGFLRGSQARENSHVNWNQILVPGELKSNQRADVLSKAWLDLARYAREVLSAQDTRRYVLGFTICGSLLRVWEFDRLGGLASEDFDINKDGLQFVSIILGFLWMSEEELGFDSTIKLANGQRFIEVERNGITERLVIVGKRLTRSRCIVGRATTCWKAHRDGVPQTPLVIKDSWQYTERDEEGELLREVTDKAVSNVARYYHHETVRIGDREDDIRINVRRGLNTETATKHQRDQSALSRSSSTKRASVREGSSTAVVKRSSGSGCVQLRSSKRSRSASATESASNELKNRVHRRVIIQDFGLPIYRASSRVALLAALEGCIEGHRSLRRDAHVLHRDISINNLMIHEDNNSSTCHGFLIDLDLAIRESRTGSSGAKRRTGTRAFMAIGAILGEQHSFMHDLESFFWVLFWICIHYNARGEECGVTDFERWNYINDRTLVEAKIGTIADDRLFTSNAETDFTPHYRPLVPWVESLRKVVFPDNQRWKWPNEGLYDSMKGILHEAKNDPNVRTF